MRSPRPVVIEVTDVRALVPRPRREDEGDLDAMLRAEAGRLAELDPPFTAETERRLAVMLSAVHPGAPPCTGEAPDGTAGLPSETVRSR